MFFVLSKTLSFLIYPFPLVMLLLVCFIILRKHKPRIAGILFYTAVTGLYIFSIEPVADLLMLPLEFPFEKQVIPKKADAIVVLSGMLDLQRSKEDRVELGSGSDRIIEGIFLAKDWPEALLILSGGSGSLFDRSTSEAELLEKLAIRLGIDSKRIRVDAQSKNTYENAVESKRILEQEKISSFVLVTSASHMKRAVGCFRKVGLEPIPYAVDFKNHIGKYSFFFFIPKAGNMKKSTAAIHEYVGLLAYKIRGYI